ncbi:MAG: ATPase, T2SS/T4P/T4SS family, partial [Lachnospiraceae bacterium]|nr:ATPase, T2SS/T4P/T4SS family [Lachnospiraceae bacterium]
MADLNRMKAALASELATLGDATDAEIRGHITDLILSESRRHYISMDERSRLAGELFAAVRRLDVLQDYIDDPDVTEIMVNGPETIFIEKNGRIEKSPKRFSSEERLLDVIRRIVGRVNRAVNEKSPIADARLPDGSRVNAVLPPASIGGPILTIRRFPREPIGMADLLKYGTLTAEAAEFLTNLVRAGYSILIGGGTSAGKTTL